MNYAKTPTDLDSPAGVALIQQAIELMRRGMAPSISMVERELRPGYSTSARIIEELEKRGIVSSPQQNGSRQFFGEGIEGRAAFEAFAAELRAGVEPAAHWFRHLTPTARAKYLPGVGADVAFADLSAADQGKMRVRYWKNLEQMRALQAQFEHQYKPMRVRHECAI